MFDDASSMYGWNGHDFEDISRVQQLGNDLRDAMEQNVYYDEVDDSGRSDDNRLGDTDDCNDDAASSVASRNVNDGDDIDEWSLQCDPSASPHDDVESRDSSSVSADDVDTDSSRDVDDDDHDEYSKKMRRRNEREKEQ